MSTGHMRQFWNARAREDAYFFVDNRRRYGEADLEAFWADGEHTVNSILGMLGVKVETSDTVLDIGCGVGRLTRVLAQRAARVYGIDVSQQMLDLARRHHAEFTNIEWIEGDGATLAPLGDASVDACISHVVFQHIPDPQITLGYIREMARVLRPGGWATFQISNDPRIHQPRTRRLTPRRLLTSLRRGPKGQSDPAWLGSAVDLGELRAVARDSGLALERVLGEGTQFCMVLARRTL